MSDVQAWIEQNTPNTAHWQNDPDAMRLILDEIAGSIDDLWANVGSLNAAQVASTLLDMQTAISAMSLTLANKQDKITAGAAITNVPNDASTSLSIILLTSAVAEITAGNNRYNTLATRFNDLLSRLRTQGLLQT